MEAVRWVLSNTNASIDLRDKEGLTPLYYACVSNCQSVVHILLAQGANVHSCDVVLIDIGEMFCMFTHFIVYRMGTQYFIA